VADVGGDVHRFESVCGGDDVFSGGVAVVLDVGAGAGVGNLVGAVGGDGGVERRVVASCGVVRAAAVGVSGGCGGVGGWGGVELGVVAGVVGVAGADGDG